MRRLLIRRPLFKNGQQLGQEGRHGLAEQPALERRDAVRRRKQQGAEASPWPPLPARPPVLPLLRGTGGGER